MSLLTKEQQETLEFIRKYIVSRRGMVNYIDVEKALHSAVAIIDNLQARAPRQYTKQELRDLFEQSHIARLIGVFDRFEENGMYKNPMIQAGFGGWKSCARFLGALKAEP